MRHDPLFHSIVATDVEKSSARNDDLLLRMRRDLTEMIGGALGRQGLDLGELDTIDDGDGLRVLVPGGVSPHVLLDPFLAGLGNALRRHRAASSPANRIRLRVALHCGLLFGEPGGTWTGTALKDCARLLDAPAGRDLLAAHPEADLVVLLSSTFHTDVVAGGASLDPGLFSKIKINVKETEAYGWAYAPEAAAPAPAPRSAAGPPRASSVTVSFGDNAQVGRIVGGDSHG